MVALQYCAQVDSMTALDATRTVAEITQTVPGAARAFERLGIDYCCRGKEPLAHACELLSLPLDAVLQTLEQGMYGRTREDVPREPRQLIRYIIERHHVFTREELARLGRLAEKVQRVHGDKRPELAQVERLFLALADDLTPHMLKEEHVLFPYIERLADGDRSVPPFGTVENPIRMMHNEHESVGALLAELEQVTSRYTPPANACGSYRALYAGLAELQADIHMHVHLENHVLFPMAVALEHGQQ
jgi:regulator of cell morphogenesis and NO signaling